MTEQNLRDAMNTHGNTVYRLALCRMQSVPDAEDVYQDVFLRLLQQQETEEWDDEHTKAWLIRATLNRCADLHRFRLRRPVLPLEEVPGMEVSDPVGEAADGGASPLWGGLLYGGTGSYAEHPGGHRPHPAVPCP